MFSPRSAFALTALLTSVALCLASHTTKRSIASALLSDFELYTRYSFGAYLPVCSTPLGNTLIDQFNNETTDTQGFITRDDTRHEIVVTFRGSSSIPDLIRDNDWTLIPYMSPGVAVSQEENVTAHRGFINAYNSVAPTIISTVRAQLTAYPSYTLISTGHSLGAALASLGGVSLVSNFPGTSLKVYTFGQPRTGNQGYATLAENRVGADNIYRVVHTYDGVPTLVPEALGFRHHLTEYWNLQDPSSADNVKVCDGEEDPTCSDSIPTTAINAAHLQYFGYTLFVTSAC
ncbi:alpha/beta-hydrolase [Phellopilus nigrolimitatus]|nr:alpha/beta-hydrolase [Phellopilus nigrolimitatus]